MTQETDDYDRIHAVMSGARRLSGSELESFLKRECGGDTALISRVQELLSLADDTNASDAFADEGIAARRLALDEIADETSETWLPDQIGDFKILRCIGRGGMGVVYEAQQSAPSRRVALKLLSPMGTTTDTLRRFKREAEALGRLQHPGIAQIFEASSFDAGQGRQPYFAMELVEGLPVTEYAEKERLNTRERLALIAELCDVIQYAHDRGVIHRDLKPANILAFDSGTAVDAAQDLGAKPVARLKVLDFGIARFSDANSAADTLQTSTGQIVGTISYMSPEQASGDTGAIDRRTDVYTLGVLAYELLSHSLPHSSKGLMLHDAVRAIREDEPTGLGTINATLRGDVETIVAKGLEKEPDRRYGSAAEMAADIRRHLEDRPIHALPQSNLYQIRKFARRNRTLVGGVVATILVAIIGSAVAIGYAIDSQNRADELERVAQFYSSQWSSIDLGVVAARLKESTVEGLRREHAQSGADAEMSAQAQELERLIEETDFAFIAMQFLDETTFTTARTTLNQQFEDLPLVRARLLETLAQTMLRLGLVHQAVPLQEEALALHQQELGDNHRVTLRSLAHMGHHRISQSKLPEASELLHAALAGQRELLPADSPEIEDTLTWLLVCGVPHEESLSIKHELLELSIARNGPEDPKTLHLHAGLLMQEGKREEALSVRMKSLAAYRRNYGEHNIATLIESGNLAVESQSLGRLEDAEDLARRMLVGSREQLGEQHPQTTNAMCILGTILRDQGRLDEAEIHLREALRLRETHVGMNDRATLNSRRELDLLLETQSR